MFTAEEGTSTDIRWLQAEERGVVSRVTDAWSRYIQQKAYSNASAIFKRDYSDGELH